MIETNFKHTDIGLIPHDWEVKTLGDIGSIRMCKRIMKHQTSDTGDIPFYKIGTFGKVEEKTLDSGINYKIIKTLGRNITFLKKEIFYYLLQVQLVELSFMMGNLLIFKIRILFG